MTHVRTPPVLVELDPAPDDSDSTELRALQTLVLSLHDKVISTGTLPEQDLSALREAGADWAVARRPLDPVLHMVRHLTDDAARAVFSRRADIGLTTRVKATGAAAARELLTGFQRSYDSGADSSASQDRRLLASSLLWGDELPAELRARAADAYAVVAVHRNADGNDLETALDHAFWSCGGHGALSSVTGEDGFVLVPTSDEASAAELCREVCRRLGGELWLGVSWRPSQEIGAARQEADSVLALARGGRRPPGAYRVEDVFVEYAVLQDPAVQVSFLELITPVLRQDSLRTTLEVFIDANGNRSKAAGELNIHRSTLDHRLGRVEQLTGCRPTGARGLQTLATALTTYRALHGGVASSPPRT
ncbi:PucR family transcriptional regulator [Lentzea sp. NEAU-D13]|uniref:PucR family transcriptional regulator n=1 Tax=Lentzea alba TaxID=2714351 RepID=A0A7C9RX30_9PSEU|nr:helix-turn-helix domain-containing protein [Lentzea alba]NGY64206.1 PucR family transcriptional regulator [Lentzea alba]